MAADLRCLVCAGEPEFATVAEWGLHAFTAHRAQLGELGWLPRDRPPAADPAVSRRYGPAAFGEHGRPRVITVRARRPEEEYDPAVLVSVTLGGVEREYSLRPDDLAHGESVLLGQEARA